MIESIFKSSASKYVNRADALWLAVSHQYSAFGRYYHTLAHLEHLTQELTLFKNQFANWDTIVFAIAYHDFFYNIFRKDNEMRSARYAEKILAETSFPKSEIERCSTMINATKHHQPSNDDEINHFTDADLAILGADDSMYSLYAKQVRKEYFVYPKFIYATGRRKVLQHFLSMDVIYKTEHFHNKYEVRARVNIKKELTDLSH